MPFLCCFGAPAGGTIVRGEEHASVSAKCLDAGSLELLGKAGLQLPATPSPQRSSDVKEAKDQGSTAQQQPASSAAVASQHPRPFPSAPSTPQSAQHQTQNTQGATWSPSQVSLDLRGLQQHSSVAELQRQERTLRALLDKVHKFGSPSHVSFATPPASSSTAAAKLGQLYDPEVSRLQQQILKSCAMQRPGVDAFDRVAQLLLDLRGWLAAAPQHGSAPLVLLYGAGEALARAEHMARSAGQVRFWSPAAVRTAVALLQVYATLMERCMAAPTAARRGDASAAGGGDGLWAAVVATLVRLLVRPSLLELLGELLELVGLDREFQAQCPRHEAVAAAVCVLDFVRDLIRFAAAHLAVVGEQRQAECTPLLADLMDPSSGPLPRLLQQPLSADTLAMQLHSLFLLQQLFDSPPAMLEQLLRTPPSPHAAPSSARHLSTSRTSSSSAPDAASFYITLHLTEAARCYFASNGDPVSACAELCILHVRLLRSLSRCTSAGASPAPSLAGSSSSSPSPRSPPPPLLLLPSSAPLRLRLNDLLLSELSAEFEASQAAAAAAAAAELEASVGQLRLGDDGSDDDASSASSMPTEGDDDGRPVTKSVSMDKHLSLSAGGSSDRPSAGTAAAGSVAHPAAGGKAAGAGPAAPAGAGTPTAFSGKFAFTYDLNEDLQRILELEDKLGKPVEVDGFEYDQEGKQLLARNSQMAVQASGAPVWDGQPGGSGRPLASSDGGRPPVPKLQFTSFSRSALSSSRSSLAPASTRRDTGSAAASNRGTGGGALSSGGGGSAGGAATALPPPAPAAQAQPSPSRMSPFFAGVTLPPMPVSDDPDRDLLASRLQLHHTHTSPLVPAAAAAAAAAAFKSPSSPTAAAAASASQQQPAVVTVAGVHQLVPHVSAIARRSPSRSRFSLEVRNSSPTFGSGSGGESGAQVPQAPVVQGGSPGSERASVHFRENSLERVHFRDGSSDAPSSLSSEHRLSCGSTHAELPLAPKPTPVKAPGLPPPVPFLDLSNLGSSSKNARGAAAAAVSSTRRGSSTAHAPSSLGTAGRSVPDSAMDTAAKSSGLYKAAVPAADAVASTPAPDGGSGAAAAIATGSAPPPPFVAADGLGAVGDPSQRLLFREPRLHLLLLSLALELSVTPRGTLDPWHWQQYPLDAGVPYNLEYVLTWHFNNGAGAAAVQELRQRLEASSSSSSSSGTSKARAGRLRLLRLLSKDMFDAGRYSELKHHSRGAFGDVFRAKMRAGEGASAAVQQVIIKTVALPSSCYDRCVLPDIFGEIAIMEHYKGCPGICQVLDYGLTEEAYWIVMRKYRCSLAEWRTRQSLGPANAAAACLYLSILLQVVSALKLLAADSVVHFDLKCANVLLDPRPGAKDSEIWNPLAAASAPPAAAAMAAASASSSAPVAAPAQQQQQQAPPLPPFQSVLADFGEARSYLNAGEAYTQRNRGTEVYKSPEMLLMNQRLAERPLPPPPPAAGGRDRPASPAAGVRPTSPAAAATKAALQGAGLASDRWSLGCLAYELLSGKVLFGTDYASVTHRVAFDSRPNLALNAEERRALGDRQEVVDLVQYVLARDPIKRPSLEQIEARIKGVQEQIWGSRTL